MKLTKKILAVVLSVLFVVGVFAGCSSKDANTKDTTTKASATQLTIRTSSQLLTKLVRLSELLMKTRFTRLMFLKVRNAQRLLQTLLTRDAQSSLPTASVTSLTLLKLLRSILKFSSAIQQVQELIQKVLTTITMHSLQFTKADILQVLLQV